MPGLRCRQKTPPVPFQPAPSIFRIAACNAVKKAGFTGPSRYGFLSVGSWRPQLRSTMAPSSSKWKVILQSTSLSRLTKNWGYEQSKKPFPTFASARRSSSEKCAGMACKRKVRLGGRSSLWAARRGNAANLPVLFSTGFHDAIRPARFPSINSLCSSAVYRGA